MNDARGAGARIAAAAVLALSAAAACAAPPVPAWWDARWSRRVPVLVRPVQDERDFPADVRVNFSNYLKEGETFDPASVRVVECDPATGAVSAACPAVFIPTDANRRSMVPASVRAVWMDPPPQTTRATSERPDGPVLNVIDGTMLFGGTVWKAGEQQPPWIVAVDLGSVQTANCVMVRYPGNGATPGQPLDAVIEVSTDSPDGLRQGTWEKVGEWKDGAGGKVYNIARVAWFAPKKVRYARLVVSRTEKAPPEIEDIQVRLARFDPAVRAEGTVNWIAAGPLPAGKDRLFHVYFNPAGGPPLPAAPRPDRIGILREAEDAAVFLSPTGWTFGPNTIEEGVSGPKNPNVLTVAVHPQKYIYWDNAGFPVTIPRTGDYTATLRVRCDPGDHGFEALVDNRPVRKETVRLGDGWTMVQVPGIRLEAGIRYLEIFLTNGKERPLDFDCLWLTDYPEFRPNAFVVPTVGRLEVRP